MSQGWIVKPNDDFAREKLNEFLDKHSAAGRTVTLTVKPEGRTSKQQAAIEVFCRELAGALNDAGIDQRVLLDGMKKSEIPNTQASIKENVYKVILKALQGKDSTTKMNTVEPNQVYESIHRAFSDRGWPCPGFPQRDSDD